MNHRAGERDEDAKVPISTATDACSTPALFCRATTNTFSAGAAEPSARLTEAQSRSLSLPNVLPTRGASAKAVTVPSAVAIRNGGLLNSLKGVLEVMTNSSAGNDT
jgi:hypothetical protein